MKRIALFFILMFLLAYAAKSQTVDSLWNGYLSPFVQTGGTAPNFNVQGQFVSNGGFTGSQIELSKKPRLIVYSSNKCYELPFTALSGTGSIIAGTVIDRSGQLSAIPSGSAIIYQPSNVYRVGPFPTGVSASLQGCLQTYNNLKIDSIQVSGGSGITLGDKQDIDVVSTNVWVIDTNAVTTIKIAASAVDSSKIAANAVRTSDIGDAQVTMPKIAQSGASSGQVIKWNGTAWAPAADNNTTYTAGSGISITGNTIQNDGVTSINGQIGDLTDFVQTTDPIEGDVQGNLTNTVVTAFQGFDVDMGTPPTTGQVLKWDGTAWVPAADIGGGGAIVPDSSFAKTNSTYPNKRITDDIYRLGTTHLGGSSIPLPSGDGAVNSQVDLKILHSRQGSSGSAPAIFIKNVSAPASPALSNAFLPLMWQLDSASCPSALPFMIYQSYFPDASSAGDNTTGGIGFNLGRGGASYVPGKPGAVIQFEQNFAANTSTGDMELWAGFNTTSPGSFRPWYFTASKTDGANSVGAISGNTLYFTNGGTQQSQTKGFWTSNYFQMQNPVINNNFALELSTLGTGQTSLRMRNPNNNYVSDVLKFANGANYLEFSGDADVKFANKIFSFDCNNEGKAIISASFNTPNPRDTINFGWWSGIPGAGVFDDAPLMRLITRDNGGFLIGRHGQLLDKYTQLGIWSNNFYISTTGAAPANTTTPAFSIQDATGNVGINVDPSSLLSANKLTVAGNVYLPPNGSAARTINWGTGAGTSAILYDGGTASRYGYGIASGEMQFFVPTGSHFSFNKGGDIQSAGTNEIMRITETGRVGIMNTAPDEALHVTGNIKTSSLAGTGTRLVVTNSAGVLAAGNAVSALMREESFTATAAQTAFTIAYNAPAVSGTSVPVRVYRNGVRLFYVASGPTITQFTYSGTTVTTAANAAGDVITVEYLN